MAELIVSGLTRRYGAVRAVDDVSFQVADGELLKAEAEFLQRLMGMLEIDEATARTVMEVLLAKNQY